MRWLLWREYRLNRLILAFAALLLLLPYVIALLATGIAVITGESTREFFGEAIAFSYSLSWLTVFLLAGNAIAGERADRSAEFIAYLPLQRWRMLASKLLLSLIAFAVILGFNTLMTVILVGPVDVTNRQFWTIVFYFSLGLLSYGSSWLASSLQSSVVFAITTGFVTTFLVSFCAMGIHVWTLEESLEPVDINEYFLKPMVMWNAAISLPVAIVCFGAGTWHYLRGSKA
jgi:ABC-type transport system involved in multi-copper enzyme maturation permease subunit